MAARTHTLRRAAAAAARTRATEGHNFPVGVGEAAAADLGGAALVGWLEEVAWSFLNGHYVFTLAKCFLVYLLALSVLGPESPAAAATAMTCDESSKRGAKLEEMNAAAGYILVHVFCRRSPKTLRLQNLRSATVTK